MSENRRYIKVDAEALRQLVREKKLRRAELGELLLLALGIDEHNVSSMSKAESVKAIGMKSPRWSRRLHQHLKYKGALDWDYDPETGYPRFRIPDAFTLDQGDK